MRFVASESIGLLTMGLDYQITPTLFLLQNANYYRAVHVRTTNMHV